ncbi:MAG: dicarboxylate/amino acid:cation symporter, partial [Bacteroidota bacterium]
METNPSRPRAINRLTLYILIAMVAGIALGFALNESYVDGENVRLVALDQSLTELSQTAGDSLTQAAARQALSAEQKELRSQIDKKLEPFSILSDIFLRLIKMIVAPLVFTTLVVGVAKLGDLKSVGRIGGKTLLWFIGASLLSLLLGMILVNLFEPGKMMNLPLPDTSMDTGIQGSGLTLKGFLHHIFPTSAIDAMAKNEILQIVVFSLFFGVGTAAIGDQGKIIIQVMDAAAHVILKVTGYVMGLAPVAVFGAMTAIVAKQGPGILKTYSLFIGEFYLSLLVLWACLGFLCYLVIGKRVVSLIQAVKEPTILAFSTSSSEAAFPKTMAHVPAMFIPDSTNS